MIKTIHNGHSNVGDTDSIVIFEKSIPDVDVEEVGDQTIKFVSNICLLLDFVSNIRHQHRCRQRSVRTKIRTDLRFHGCKMDFCNRKNVMKSVAFGYNISKK